MRFKICTIYGQFADMSTIFSLILKYVEYLFVKKSIRFQIITNVIFDLNIVQFVIMQTNMGKVASSHCNPCEEPHVTSNRIFACAATLAFCHVL
jgi:hypothetical protein